jgi:hypothetical protein
MLANNDFFVSYSLANHKTNNNLRCIRCPSLILRPTTKSSTVLIDNVKLPQLKKHDMLDSANFIRIYDMMLFENIGVSRPSDNEFLTKYLLCADCEVGPIGFEGKDENGVVCFNVAADRVRYECV